MTVTLLGVGESNDAYHMSSPHPQGLGASAAMRAALRSAGLDPGEIDYINLHGTGTQGNDSAEGHAVEAVFGASTPCSSTKGATGHTLGAAGALEAVICALALRHAFMPGGLNTTQVDTALAGSYLCGERGEANSLAWSAIPLDSAARTAVSSSGARDEATSDMSALSAYIQGIGVLGPGLRDWPGATVAVLSGTAPHVLQATQVPVLEVLPPAERRRTGRVVRLALAVGLEAASRAGEEPGGMPSVFTSSSGDGQNCHELCEVLASSDRRVSPTRFHNSVHNAAAGYWSIATGAKAPSTALCAYDASFAAGLLEAMAQVLVDQTTVLLLAYDVPYPEPLHAKRPMADAFGVALVLAPRKDASSLARLTAAFTEVPASRMRRRRA